ncbi:MAG TPA: hypothetical protein VKY85_07045 [Candidatus Angelobacter sp.]|nr:hypothetical protein [Candidatus Angelobacter sp.]
MKRQLAIVAFLCVASLAALGEHLTGYVSDLQCATSGSKAAKATDWINPKAFESCAQKCAKNGSPLVFVTEDNKVLKLDADSTQKATAHLGHRVSVSGKVENGALKIDKISTIQMEAQSKPANHQEENMH